MRGRRPGRLTSVRGGLKEDQRWAQRVQKTHTHTARLVSSAARKNFLFKTKLIFGPFFRFHSMLSWSSLAFELFSKKTCRLTNNSPELPLEGRQRGVTEPSRGLSEAAVHSDCWNDMFQDALERRSAFSNDFFGEFVDVTRRPCWKNPVRPSAFRIARDPPLKRKKS